MANVRFASGSVSLPSGTIEYTLTGLLLPFTPDTVNVSLALPNSDAEVISVNVAGGISTDGFKVVLSSATEEDGYILSWTATQSGSGTAVAGDTLAVSYDDLKSAVSAFLGYDTDALTTAQTQEIDGIIQSGIRRFYYPPMMQGVEPNYEWSFLHMEGTVALTAGVSEYDLPDGFGRVLSCAIGTKGEHVPVLDTGYVKGELLRNAGTGRPCGITVQNKMAFGNRGQTKKLIVYPVPDDSYTLVFQCDADQGRIDPETNPFPLGGVINSELIIESCLAVAEQRSNDERGIHTQNFNELLVSSIQRDRRGGAQVFGKVGDARYHHHDFFTE